MAAVTGVDGAKRVLIADDHPLYCEALRAIVPQACPEAEIREADSQDAVLAILTSDTAFDLVLLDLNLPGATGLSCLVAVRQVAPLTPVVMISAVDDPRTMRETILGGANAYVPKSAPRQVLLNAISAILEGGTYMPAEVVAMLRQAHVQGRDEPHESRELTLRQRAVVELLSRGLPNKEIARALEISEITVKAHVSSIFRKLGVTNRVQAVIKAGLLVKPSAY